MKILIFISHPAQFLFFKNQISELRERGLRVFILIKTKDILAGLLDELGWEYYNILPNERGKSKFQIIWSLLIRDLKLFRYAIRRDIDLLMGTDASLAHVGKILGKPCITTLEDDYGVIKKLADLTYPFTSSILVPTICDVGRWERKKIGYEGYMKLAYLHPNRFSAERDKVRIINDKPYYLIRLSGLSAHHDFGIKGISYELLDSIISRLSLQGNVYISSEKELPASYDRYRLLIPLTEMHHYLNFADLLICDSQSMAVEASMLGVPNVRISSFVGRIGVLEELEHKYELTYGVKPEDQRIIFEKLEELLSYSNLKGIFQARRQKMLSDKIDVTAFMVWFVENYPESVKIMKANPDYQNRFKTIC